MDNTPLQNADVGLIPKLGQALWSWETRQGGAPVTAERCKHLHRYFQFYTAAVSTYLDASPNPAARSLLSHEDLFRAISTLRSNPALTKKEYCQAQFPPTSELDFSNAAALVVRVFVMIESGVLHHSSNRLEKGSFRIHWKDNVAFSQYLQQLFPTENHAVLGHVDNELFLTMKSSLRANKLKKHLRISFRATHDIRNHLSFDRQANVIDIYHHTAFIKEQLRTTQEGADFSTPTLSIEAGSLPRQLLLEVLDSIQGVLFPLSDPKCKRILQSLVTSCSFDPDIVNFEYGSIRRPGEENISYIYLADRLSDLYSEIYNPQPRGWLERRIERKSGARYMMLATLIGVSFAIFLGMVSLAVSSYQTWIAYQAWQHPVATVSA
ncbi:hypothetical protein QBC34DRAFT_489622 [Podospora aff. communis PSN243]|uniref:Uncharacterized protein n=1 Tax=Podospora aff. communis PSN243 TaxID=3040156 RepID=A0AAV9H4G6_9PEZI|nr:hypothetical protein QBC34DRAFT_489622 [Podospora aff. communis PSN243]